jgi:hypothetical protein
MNKREAEALYKRAHEAGIAAFHAAKPTPMIVGEAKSLFSNEIDYTKKTYYEADGVCGFAWIKVRPARGAFVAYCKANKIGYSSSYGGYQVSPKGEAAMSQSYARKMAYAGAFAKVLNDAGLDAYADGRLD